MSLSTALDLIVARIEDYTPTRDPSTHWKRAGKLSSKNYRQFSFVGELQIIPEKSTGGPTNSTTVDIEFYYSDKIASYERLKDITSDAKELFDRVIHSAGSEYGKSEVSLVVQFNDLTINIEENTINLSIDLIYNV